MPYLDDPQLREMFDRALDALDTNDSAELNYVICRLVDTHLSRCHLSYKTITDIRGAIFGAWQEFERVIAGPYEEIKRKQNGDVWTHIPGQWTGGPTASP